MSLSLYYRSTCPYCISVLNYIRNQSILVDLRDVSASQKYEVELKREGGKVQVPCLKIEAKGESTIWLYESTDILAYLDKTVNHS